MVVVVAVIVVTIRCNTDSDTAETTAVVSCSWMVVEVVKCLCEVVKAWKEEWKVVEGVKYFPGVVEGLIQVWKVVE